MKKTATGAPEPSEFGRYTLKAVTQCYYDYQRLRIAVANRIKKAEAKEADLTIYDVKLYEGMVDDLKKREDDVIKRLTKVVEEHEMWPWLSDVKGVGVAIAAAMLSQFDITKAPRPSNFWSFAGLSVKDGRAPRREKGETMAYNGWLRTKLVGVLGPSFLKCTNPIYRPIYDDYIHRLHHSGECSKSAEEHKGRGSIAEWVPSGSKGKPKDGDFCTKGHLHNKAIRYMVKMFLLHFWTEWRKVRGLPVVAPYSEAKLGLKHGE